MSMPVTMKLVFVRPMVFNVKLTDMSASLLSDSWDMPTSALRHDSWACISHPHNFSTCTLHAGALLYMNHVTAFG